MIPPPTPHGGSRGWHQSPPWRMPRRNRLKTQEDAFAVAFESRRLAGLARVGG